MAQLVQISPFTIKDAEKIDSHDRIVACIKYYSEFFSRKNMERRIQGRPNVLYTYVGGWIAT